VSEDDLTPDDTPRKKRKKLLEDTDAKDLREQNLARKAAQDERRMRLQLKLSQTGHGHDEDHGQIIINDAKSDDQGYILVTKNTAPRIKKHQIEGVRFMWNQIVGDGDAMQGCLLAHTMGLGKTMQV
jgi:SNF2 family DNA or RNA helicase